jgi:hypothetical protein
MAIIFSHDGDQIFHVRRSQLGFLGCSPIAPDLHRMPNARKQHGEVGQEDGQKNQGPWGRIAAMEWL